MQVDITHKQIVTMIKKILKTFYLFYSQEDKSISYLNSIWMLSLMEFLFIINSYLMMIYFELIKIRINKIYSVALLFVIFIANYLTYRNKIQYLAKNNNKVQKNKKNAKILFTLIIILVIIAAIIANAIHKKSILDI